jgi:hypothetical protein
MKSSILWVITACILLKVNRSFGETSLTSSGSKSKLNK